ncbi:MAG: cation-transporting P-type ATPase [Desulfobacterales bacterium]
MKHLPKLNRPTSPKTATDHSIHFSPLLAEVAKLGKSEVFSRMKTAPEGLSTDEADSRWVEVGPNVVAASKHRGWPWRLLSAARNPLVILLVVLATISFATGDAASGVVMAVMVILGVLLRFVQETRTDAAAEKLKAMINTTATVVRAGKEAEIPLKQLNAIQNFGAMDVLCTNKMPFIHGRASWQLTLTTGAIMAVAAWLPYSPVAPALGFTELPKLYWPILLATLLCYVVLTQIVKMWLIRKTWL